MVRALGLHRSRGCSNRHLTIIAFAVSLAACGEVRLAEVKSTGDQPRQLAVAEDIPGARSACENGVTTAKLDVLFVIDDSVSMADTQAALKEQITRFVARFAQLRFDYRLAVTTTSLDGRKRPPGALVSCDGVKVVTGDDPKRAAQDFATVLGCVDTKGSDDEYGVLAATLALMPEEHAVTRADRFAGELRWDGARDTDFLRADARTLVVIVSDEDDRSDMALDVDALRAQIPQDFRLVAVVDPAPGPKQGCASTNAWEGAPNYHAALQRLAARGTLVDFCSDVATTVDMVALEALRLSCQ